MVFNIFMWLPAINSKSSLATFSAGLSPLSRPGGGGGGGGGGGNATPFAVALTILNLDGTVGGPPASIIELTPTTAYVRAAGVGNALGFGAWSVSTSDPGTSLTQAW
jgi:hypothetical protein